MKKNKLIFDYQFDFEILGFVAPVKDYKLAWAINKLLDLRLKKVDDYYLELINQPDLMVPQFIQIKEHGFVQLLKNKSNTFGPSPAYLIPELKVMDYFMLVQDFTEDININTYIERLSTVDFIQNVVKIDVTKLKSKENLLTY
ncbi:IPExxxVDY family protein [Mongoliitalea daihaiensis]|uniref:IPExxxVDY family protein n=1 Tax=Mongoliitalea daihaiensis TaxID=2782006 RepID=UPI001F26C429|nr:IPExxxVDY family protein [Mongoliitalea daihaiensis]UJP64606.1 IPExxxVDY family protein [Mongoliitalea daihaiensis]